MDNGGVKVDKREEITKDLKNRILLLDGAMGTMIQKEDLSKEDFGGEKYEGCNDYLVLTRPDIIKQIHKKYIESGSDIIETNTFGALNIVLNEYGLENKDIEMNIAAVNIVKSAIEEYRNESGNNRRIYIAGALGPTSKSISVTGGVTFDELINTYYRAVSGLLEGGIDLLLFETIQDTRNLKAAYVGAKRAFDEKYEVPIMLSFTIESTGTTLAGQTAEAFYYATKHMKPLSIGLNCATGPEFMENFLAKLSDVATDTFISAYPNAGLPNEDGVYNETPETLAEKVNNFFEKEYINIVGGCCGTTPEHIAKIKEKTENHNVRQKKETSTSEISGLIVSLDKEGRPMYVGERTNVIGSRIFKNLIVAEKFDDATEVARLQIKGDADVIDICLANPDRDEVEDMSRFLDKVSKFAKIPIMIDSTDINVVEKSLSYLQGKGIINSINLEDGEEKFDKMSQLIKQYGAAVVVGLIDEEGMAVDLEKKVRVARRSHELLTKKYGNDERDIIFDTLVFPVATGDQKYIGSATATIEAIREIKKEFPNVKTILGVSNISFGLPIAGREVLNTYYMQKAYEAGLDFAIVNTEKLIELSEISSEELKLAEDILFNTNDKTVADFVALYRERKGVVKEVNTDNFTTEEKVSRLVVEGSKQNLQVYLEELRDKYKPLDIINGPLMTGMDEVGRLFNNNDLIVAEVLQSAEVMKAAVSHLEQYMEKSETVSKGKVLLATVKGDVHDIGKNLVGIILGNNGYDIVDLGINVTPEKLREVILEEKPDFIGLSGLLVKSATEMVNTVKVFKDAGIEVPILVGGAALTEKFTINKIEKAYEKNIVIYSKDAMTALSDLNKLIDENKKNEVITHLEERRKLLLIENNENNDNADSDVVRETVGSVINKGKKIDFSTVKLPEFEFENIYKPKELKDRVYKNISAKEVFKYINLQMLMGKHLGMKWIIGDLIEQNDPKAIKLYNEILEIVENGDKYFDLKGMYKYFPCRRNGNKIEILDDNLEVLKVIEEFEFPRQEWGDYLSLVDYIHPTEIDYIGMFVVSSGEKSRTTSEELKANGEFYKSHLVMSIGLELAECVAEYIHAEMRRELGIENEEMKNDDVLKAKYQGNRYSFGYPACPELSDQKKLFDLLKPESKIEVVLTEGFMMYPEASVSAIVFAQPFTKYFNI